jgi:hypothetical protein
MGKITVGKKGTIKIKMDTPDSFSFDAKDPHVSLEGKSGEIIASHIDLYSVDSFVGDSKIPYFKESMYWIRYHKDELIKMYKNKSPYYIDD